MKRSPRKALLGTLATVLLAPGVLPSLAQAQDRQSYDAELTSERPGATTGLRQEIHYVNPDDRGAKPHAVEEIILRLPPGARIDTSVPAQCNASDAEFQLEGAAACPPPTKVGVGSLSVDFGAGAGPVPRVVENDGTFFNNEDELILFTESTNTPGEPIRTANRFEVGRRTFVSSVPPLPGTPPPDPFAAIKDVFNRLEKVTRGPGKTREAYITTPATCPPRGQWMVTAIFTYRDGVVQTERSATPCKANRSTPNPPGGGDDDREDRRGAGRFPRGGVEAGHGGAVKESIAALPLSAGLFLVTLAASGFAVLRRRV